MASILFTNKFQGIDKKRIAKIKAMKKIWKEHNLVKNAIQRVINLEYRTKIYFDSEHRFCADYPAHVVRRFRAINRNGEHLFN